MADKVTRRTTLAALAGGAVPLMQEPGAGRTQQLDDAPRYWQGAAPFVRTRNALEKLREIGAGVRDTGAIGDGRADDTPAIQEIADYFARAGGEWYFPQGVFRTTAPLVWNGARPQRIRGRGKRGVYPGRYDPGAASDLAVILPVHAGRAAIQFAGAKIGDGSIELHGVALATLETGPVPIAGFAWDAAAGFLRNFIFADCSIHGFTSAFDLFRSGGRNIAMGLFKAYRCTINRNHWIARTLDGTQWNGFALRDSEAGQNGYLPGQGGIAVAAHNAVIAGNCLEGQRDPIKLSGAMRGLSIRDNYFEANVGAAAIHLQNIRGPFDIGANSFVDVDPSRLDHLVLLTDCGHGRVLGPYWANGVHKMALPILGAGAAGDNSLNPGAGSDAHGLLRLDGFDHGGAYTRAPFCSAIATQRVTIAGRELAPWNGRPMPVAQHDTADSAAIVLDYPIAGAAGDWVALSWLFRREPGAETPSDPHVGLSVNGTGAQGSRSYAAYNFDEYWRAGEWCLLTAAIRLKAAMSRLAVTLHPHGVKPAPGRRSRYLRPVVYVTDSPAKVIPYIDDYTARSVTAPPNVMGFQQGDVLINGAVAAGGQARYVKLGGADDAWVYG